MEIHEQLQIAIEFAPRLQRFAAADSSEQKSLHDSLSFFVGQLVTGLNLPVQPVLSFSSGDSQDNDFSTTINGQQCRLPLPTKVPEQAGARELASLLAAGIFQNRELCLPRSLSERLYREWQPPDQGAAPKLSLDEFHQLLLGLVRRGFGIDRARAIAVSNGGSVEGLLEGIVAGSSSLRLYLGKQQASISSFHAGGNKEQSVAESVLELAQLTQKGIFYELGTVLPSLSIEVDDRLEGNEFQVQINDLRQPPLRGLDQDQILVNDTVARLGILQVSGEQCSNPANGNDCALVRGAEAAGICGQAGLTTWGPAGFVILSLSREIRRHAGQLLTRDLVEFLIAQLGQVYPALTAAALARFDLTKLTLIFRDLLDEEISIRDLRTILEGLLAFDGAASMDLMKYIAFFPYTLNLSQRSVLARSPELKVENYSEYVRTFLKRYISHKYTRGQSTLIVYLVDPEIEARLSRIETEPLSSIEQKKLINALLAEVGNLPPSAQVPVLLTTTEIRAPLRILTRQEFPSVAVLAYQELAPELNIQPIARISWN